jgi:hypothetical protein
MPLVTSPNLVAADAVYAALVAAHRGRDAESSAALNARLILLLANHIGDGSIVIDAIHRAAEPTSETGAERASRSI